MPGRAKSTPRFDAIDAFGRARDSLKISRQLSKKTRKLRCVFRFCFECESTNEPEPGGRKS